MASPIRQAREWGGHLATTCGGLFILVAVFVCAMLVYERGLPTMRGLPFEHTPEGLVDTLDYFLSGDYPYLPRDVVLSEQLRGLAPQYGFELYDLQAIIAAAHRLRIQPEHIIGIQMNARLSEGFRDMYPLSLAIGQFLAQHGYHDSFVPCPDQTPIPSDTEPTAIPCIERDPKHLAIMALNPAGSEEWLGRVLSTATIWASPMGTAEVKPTAPPTIVHEISVLIEMVRLREAGYFSELVLVNGNPVVMNNPDWDPIDYPSVPDGYFVHPFPGSRITGYDFGDPVYSGGELVRDHHPGIDLGGIGQSPVYAACNGEVIYAGWMNSGSLWVSGIVVGIRCNPPSENSVPICTLYGHGTEGTLQVGKGDRVNAGQALFLADNTGFSFGNHLHFDIRVGNGEYCGQSVDPKAYLP